MHIKLVLPLAAQLSIPFLKESLQCYTFVTDLFKTKLLRKSLSPDGIRTHDLSITRRVLTELYRCATTTTQQYSKSMFEYFVQELLRSSSHHHRVFCSVSRQLIFWGYSLRQLDNQERSKESQREGWNLEGQRESSENKSSNYLMNEVRE